MLKIYHLTKTYPGGKVGVDDLSLEVKKGEIYGFIGHNGAGKTTTIKAIVGLHDFEQGSISIDGIAIKDDPLSAKSVTAYIPDNPELYDNLSGLQFLNFVADVFRVPKSVRKESHTQDQVSGTRGMPAEAWRLHKGHDSDPEEA